MVIRELFDAAADAAQRLVDSDEVAAQWADPSALEGYTVGGLAGHLGRAILTVQRYLDAPPPPADAELSDAAGYFEVVLGDHDPVHSDVHRSIRARSQEEAADGPSALAATLRETHQTLEARFDAEGMGRRLAVRDGVAMTLEAYLTTRLVELVIHLDDLAVSVGRTGPEGLPAEAYDVVAAVLARIATRQGGGLDTVRGLARAERHPDPVRAL